MNSMTEKILLNWNESTNLSLEQSAKRYWVKLFCSNCQTITAFTLPKGTRKAGIKAECEKCGCKETL